MKSRQDRIERVIGGIRILLIAYALVLQGLVGAWGSAAMAGQAPDLLAAYCNPGGSPAPSSLPDGPDHGTGHDCCLVCPWSKAPAGPPPSAAADILPPAKPAAVVAFGPVEDQHRSEPVGLVPLGSRAPPARI